MDDTTAVRGGRDLITSTVAAATPGMQSGPGVPDTSLLSWHDFGGAFGTGLVQTDAGPSGLLDRSVSGDTADPRRPNVTGTSEELVYHSDTVNVEPIVETAVWTDPTLGLPTQLQAQLTWNKGTPQSWVTFSTSGHHAGDVYDLGLQVASPVTTTASYFYQVEVKTFYSSVTIDRIYTGYANVVVQGGTDYFGPGWSLAGLDQLVTVTNGLLWVDGSGGWRYFQNEGAITGSLNSYLSPPQDLGTLAQVTGGYVYTAKDQTKWNFNGSGLLTSIVDPRGLALTYSYVSNTNGGIVTLATPDGGLTTFSYGTVSIGSPPNLQDVLTLVQEPGGRTLSFGHDGSTGNLTSVTQADGSLRSFQYDSVSHLTNERWGPLSVTVTYDSTTGLATTLNWGGGTTLAIIPAASTALTTSPSWNLSDLRGRLTDSLGQVASYQLDAYDRLTRLESPDGAVSRWNRDFTGQPTQYIDPLSRLTTLAYQYTQNGDGDLTLVTNPDGSQYAFAYEHTFHRPTQITDTRGDHTQVTYDGTTGDLRTVEDAASNTTTYAWSGGLLQSVTDPLGHAANYSWNTASRELTATVDAAGDRVSYAYDGSGNPTSVEDARGFFTTSTFDGMRRVLTQTDASGATVSYAYNGLGEVTQAIDGLGRTTSYNYESHGWLQSETDAVGTSVQRTTSYAYDKLGRATALTDANGHVVTSTFDTGDRLASTQNAVGARTSYAYDAADELTSTTDPNGHTTAYGYNKRGWQTLVQDALSESTQTGYDGEGNATLLTDPLGHVTTTQYDPLNRATQVQDPTGALTSTQYDPAGNVTATADADGHWATTTYDAANRPTQVQDAAGGLATTIYDGDGNVSVSIDPNGSRTTYTYDGLDRATQVQDAAGGLTTTFFDKAGNVTLTIDALGHHTATQYDPLNQPTAVQDAAGGLTTTGYDPAGNVTVTVDPDGHRTSYSYDPANEQTQVQDAAGGLTTTAYDPAGNVTLTIDADGHRTSTLYDVVNRPTEVDDAAGGRTTTAYDAAGNVTLTTDPLGHATSDWYDKDNRLTEVFDAAGGFATTAYDKAGNVTLTIDQLGHRTTYQYDGLNRQTSAEDATGATVLTAYDPDGNATAVTDARGHTTTTGYDGLNRPTQVEDAAGNLSTTQYDRGGNVTRTIDARGNAVSYGFDALDRPTSQTDALGHTTTTQYDPAGNATAVTDPGGFTATTAYDPANRPTQVQDPAGGLATTAYDPAGNATLTVDPLGARTTTQYDGLNRATQVQDARGGLTTTQYDLGGNETTVIDADGNRTTMQYDVLNRLTKQIDPLGHAATMAYDAASRKTSSTDRDGRVIDYTYDNANRETGETWIVSGSTTNLLTFTYDGNGNELTAANFAGTYTFSYDILDRPTVTQEPFGQVLTAAYDAVNNRTQLADSQGGLMTSAYDPANRLTLREETGQAPVRLDFTYNTRDELASVTRSSDLAGTTHVGSSAYAYDGLARVTNLQHLTGSGANIANFTYTYDPASDVKSETLNGTTTSYNYDATHELTSDSVKSYSYDSTGNRTMTGYQTGTGNQMTNDGVYTYTYDAEGNLIEKSASSAGDTWLYSYDNDNRLIGVQHLPTNSAVSMMATYVYDALGNRVEKDVWQGGVTTVTRYAYDGQNIWATFDGSNHLQVRYVWGDQVAQLLVQVSAGGVVSWVLTDRLGSVRNIEDNSQVVQDTIAYSGYGVITSESNSAWTVGYTFTGALLDKETGLQEHPDRYYDPTTGRWTGPDPSGLAAGDPNLYRYVANNPTDAVDPTGLEQLLIKFRHNGETLGKLKVFWNNEDVRKGGIGATFYPDASDLGSYVTFLNKLIKPTKPIASLGWYQIVTADMHPPVGKKTDKQCEVPYIDPPAGGYKTKGAPWNDDYPWYQPVVPPPPGVVKPDTDSEVLYDPKRPSISFADGPDDLQDNKLAFKTWLVALDKEFKPVLFMVGFSWEWEIKGNERRVFGVKELDGPPSGKEFKDILKPGGFSPDFAK